MKVVKKEESKILDAPVDRPQKLNSILEYKDNVS